MSKLEQRGEIKSISINLFGLMDDKIKFLKKILSLNTRSSVGS